MSTRRTPIQKAIDDLKADPRVANAWSEGDNGCEGYRPGHVEDVWADLKPGFVSELGTHSLHEDTPARLRMALSQVEPCACDRCTEACRRAA
jgi:hypothetical protein